MLLKINLLLRGSQNVPVRIATTEIDSFFITREEYQAFAIKQPPPIDVKERQQANVTH